MKTSMKTTLALTAALCFVSAYAEPVIKVKTVLDVTSLQYASMKDGIITVRKNGEVHSRKQFTVDPNAKYKISADVRLVSGEIRTVLLGFGSLDEKGRRILPHQVCVRTNSYTELAAPVKKGDTVIMLKNASKWDRTPTWNHAVLEPEKDLSDLPSKVLYRQKKLTEKDNVWELQVSTPVQKDYPAGTAVRQQYDSGTYSYTVKLTNLTDKWTHAEGIISGIAPSGNPNTKFWKGVKTADLIIVITGQDPAVVEVKNLQAEIVK